MCREDLGLRNLGLQELHDDILYACTLYARTVTEGKKSLTSALSTTPPHKNKRSTLCVKADASSSGVYFRPRQGTIIAFNSKEVYHSTRQNVGFKVGASLSFKIKVANGAARRQEQIKLA